jgi:hypothetical protein
MPPPVLGAVVSVGAAELPHAVTAEPAINMTMITRPNLSFDRIIRHTFVVPDLLCIGHSTAPNPSRDLAKSDQRQCRQGRHA